MKNKWSKLLTAMLLSACVVLTLLPFAALADEVQAPVPAAEENLSSEAPGPVQEAPDSDEFGPDSAVPEVETPEDERSGVETLLDESTVYPQGETDAESGENVILRPGQDIPGKDFTIPGGVDAVIVPSSAGLEQIELIVSAGALGSVVYEGTVSLPDGSKILLPDGTVFQNTQFKFAEYNYDVFAAWVDGHLCISGKNTWSFSGPNAKIPWSSDRITSVAIMDGITGIGKYAFWGCDGLKSIYIPSSVTQIGENAFDGCSGLIVYVDNCEDADLDLLQDPLSDSVYYVANLNGYTMSICRDGGLAAPVKDSIIDGAWYDTDGNVLQRDADGCYRIPDDAESGSVYTAGEIKADIKVSHTITFVVDGKTLKEEKLDEGAAVVAPPVDSRDGYVFQWDDLPEYMPDKDITVTGIYTAKQYTVTFDAGSGTIAGSDTAAAAHGQTVAVLPSATRSNYAFKGWFSDQGEFTTETPVTGDITVTAKWVRTFTVTIEDGHGGEIFKQVYLKDVETGTVVSAGDIDEIAAAGEALGWKLLGWTRGASSNQIDYQPNDPLVVVNKNFVRFTAKWELLPTQPVFSSGRNIRVEFRDENGVQLSVVGFTTEMNGDGAYFTLSEVMENDGSNSAAPAKDYPYQCVLTLNTEAMISRWEEVTGARVLDGEAHPQIMLYCRGGDGRWATWVDGVGSYSYVVNYSVKLRLPDCVVTVDGTEYTVKHGASLKELLETVVPAAGSEGQKFVAWTYADGTEIPESALVTGETAIVSTWETVYYAVIIDGEEHEAPHGFTLSLLLPEKTPSPPEGMEFDTWVDGDGVEITRDAVVTGPMTVTAKWKPIIYTLTYVIDGATVGTQEYGMGDAIEVMIAPERFGYTFSGWTGLPENNVMPAADITITGSYRAIFSPPAPSVPSGPVTPVIPAVPSEPSEEPGEEIEEPDTPLASIPFLDVAAGVWYADPIMFVLQKDLMQGTSETTFEPMLTFSRSMMAQLLYNLDGRPDTFGSPVFADVSSGAWYSEVVNWAAASGFVNGYGDGTFGPEDSITREQMILILYNYARLRGMDAAADAQSLLDFRDSGEISDWARQAMAWGVTCGLTYGCGDNTLAPQSTASRAEAAALVMRFYNIFLEDVSLGDQSSVV